MARFSPIWMPPCSMPHIRYTGVAQASSHKGCEGRPSQASPRSAWASRVMVRTGRLPCASTSRPHQNRPPRLPRAATEVIQTKYIAPMPRPVSTTTQNGIDAALRRACTMA